MLNVKKAQSSVSRDVFVAVLCSSALHHTNFSNLSSMMRTFFSILILLAAFFISAFVNFPPNVSSNVYTVIYRHFNTVFSALNFLIHHLDSKTINTLSGLFRYFYYFYLFISKIEATKYLTA